MEDTLKKQYLKKNEILILLQAIENGEIETINSYINDEQLKEKIQRIYDENRFDEETDNIEKEYFKKYSLNSSILSKSALIKSMKKVPNGCFNTT